jgi:hypothetical protein
MPSHGWMYSRATLLTQPHDMRLNKRHGLLMLPSLNSPLRNMMRMATSVQRLPLSFSLGSHRSFMINASTLLSNWTRWGCVKSRNIVVTKGYHSDLMLRYACQRIHRAEMRVWRSASIREVCFRNNKSKYKVSTRRSGNGGGN